MVDSQRLIQAIIFARSIPKLADRISKRDNDPNLSFRGIYCSKELYENDRGHFYLHIVFDFRESDDTSGDPDLFIDLRPLNSGGFEILPPPYNLHIIDQGIQ
jgi:hypothetical protein